MGDERARLDAAKVRMRAAWTAKPQGLYELGAAAREGVETKGFAEALGYADARAMWAAELPEIRTDTLMTAEAVAAECSAAEVEQYGFEKMWAVTRWVREAGWVRPPGGLEAWVVPLVDDDGQRTLAKVFLAMGKNKEALAQAEHVAKEAGRMSNPGALLTLGLAQQYNGLDAQAQTTWKLGLAAWPGSVLLQDAVHGPKQTVFEWQDEELSLDVWWYAERLAFGGHLLSELGLPDRANALYAESEREEPGHALPHQLVFLGMSKPEEALQKALAAVKSAEAAHAPPNVRLLSATAWLYLRLKKVEDAKRWVQKALDVWAWDPKAMSLMWQVCGEEKDYICVIKYRKRLGLPTHFNVAQYQDVKKAWEEQAVKNGVGLAARETPSADAPKPPRIDSVVIVPLGWRVAPELEGMAAFLKKEFPSLKISVAEPEQPPAGAYDIERRAMLWERLAERLREEPGRIYVVEQDLSSLDRGFAYARYDLAHGRGVVSLARMRSLVGDPVDPENPSGDDEITRAVRHRLASELVHGIGELLGLSFPCQEPKCAMHERRSIRDFVLRTPSLCPKHQQELKEAGRGGR